MIRELTENDFDDAISVICNSFMTVAEEFNITKENAPAFTAFATDKSKLRTWMFEQHRPMYGYFNNGKMAGYYNLMINENECELGSLSVLPEYRHKGIGRKLLEDSLSKASGFGCTIMKLSIVEENKILRKWYEDQGFIHTGTEKYDFFPFTCGYLEKNL
ncbi:MAG: GNAT family N-acetyltransferase [Eubacterium sp.]|nr:GNAT family N-acetyltransferase [Eubacterium sp.]